MLPVVGVQAGASLAGNDSSDASRTISVLRPLNSRTDRSCPRRCRRASGLQRAHHARAPDAAIMIHRAAERLRRPATRSPPAAREASQRSRSQFANARRRSQMLRPPRCRTRFIAMRSHRKAATAMPRRTVAVTGFPTDPVGPRYRLELSKRMERKLMVKRCSDKAQCRWTLSDHAVSQYHSRRLWHARCSSRGDPALNMEGVCRRSRLTTSFGVFKASSLKCQGCG